MPNLNAQNVAINGVGAIRVQGVTPNLLAVPKSGTINVWVGYGFFSGGLDGYQLVTVSPGQPIGTTTGTTGWTGIEVKLSVTLGGGKYPAGSSVYIPQSNLDLKAPSTGGGATGGDINFPITFGSRNDAVRKYQQWLINCGYNLGSTGADGSWGNMTQLASLGEGITSINSKTDLDRITAGACRRTSGGGGGGANPPIDPTPPIDPNPLPVVTPAQDNTMLYLAGGAVALALLMKGKKKKGKKK